MSGQSMAHDGLEGWRSSLQAICGQFETRMALDRALFIGEISLQCRAGLPMARLRTNAGLITRDSIKPDHDDDQNCFLVSQRSGCSQITQNGTSIQLAPGDLLLMDSVGSCEITPSGLIEHASLSLPRSEVDRVIKHEKFGKVSAASPSGKMLHMLIDQLCREPESSHDAGAESEALRTAFISLLVPALSSSDSQPGSSDLPQRDNLRRYVHKIIDESLSQPNLNPAGLAARLNISVRHLYRLFEEQGDSVCRYIQRARLERSAEDLSNPLLRSESITSIAYKWGFTDSAHFSRAFRKRFARSPKEYRAMALMETAGAA